MTIGLMFCAIADDIPDLAPLSTPERLRFGVAERYQALAGRLPHERRWTHFPIRNAALRRCFWLWLPRVRSESEVTVDQFG
jgi:hypothetical protein